MAMSGAIRAGRAFVEIFADDSKAIRVLKRFQHRMVGFATSMKAIGKSMTLLGGAGLGLSAFAGGGVLKSAARWEELSVAFTTMLGSGEKAKQLLAELEKFAGETPFGTEGAADAAKQLLGFGFAAEEVVSTLTMLGDIASGLSIPLEELVYLYGTARTEGRLFAKDLNQFLGRGIPLMQGLAERFGVAESEVRKLVEEGRVGFEDVRAVLEDLTTEGGQFGGLMAERSKTLNGILDSLSDSFQTIKRELGSALLPLAKTAATAFAAVAEATKAWIRENGELVRSIAIGGVAIAAAFAAIGAAGIAIYGTGAALSAVASGVGVLATALTTGTALLLKLPVLFGALLSPIGIVGVAIAGIGGYMLYSSGIIDQAISGAKTLFADLSADVLQGWGGVVDAISAGDLGLAFEIIAQTGRVAWDGLMGYVKGLWTNFKAFANQVFIEATTNLSSAFLNAFASIKIAWIETTSGIASIWDTVITAVRKGWQRISSFFAGIIARVTSAFNPDVSFEDVKKELAALNSQELNSIQQASDARQLAIEQERQKQRETTAENLKDSLAANQEIRDQRTQSAEDERDKALQALQDRLTASRAELDQLTNRAKERRREVESATDSPTRKPLRPDLPTMEQLTGNLAVMGTFSAAAASGLGGGAGVDQLIKKTNEINQKALETLQDINKHLVPALAGTMFQ